MKRNLLFVILAITGLLLWMSSCQKAPELTLTGPTNFELSADGGSATINFTANRDWRVNSSDDWITISPSSGAASNGTIAVSVKCNANTTYDDRAATVTISMEGLSQSVTVKQSANSGVLVPKTSYEVSSGAQTIEVEVQKNVNYTVEIEESCKSWIKKVGTKALTSEKIVFDISENTSFDARKGTITIIPFTGPEQTVVVNQDAKEGIQIENSYYSMSASGGSLEVLIQTNVEVEVLPEPSWIHYSQTKALTDKTIVLTIDKNESNTSREGKVTTKSLKGDITNSFIVSQSPKNAVDLGIVMKRPDGTSYALYWAECNLDASSPEEFGGFYAWGETETKNGNYDWNTYKWGGGYRKVTKYCPFSSYWAGTGTLDNKTELDPEDDAAHVKLGGKWRMPTHGEFGALVGNCTYTWTSKNGVDGAEFKSKLNSNTIFLPAAGINSGGYSGTWGLYWSSSLYYTPGSSVGSAAQAYELAINSSRVQHSGQDRDIGLSIRPVTE